MAVISDSWLEKVSTSLGGIPQIQFLAMRALGEPAGRDEVDFFLVFIF